VSTLNKEALEALYNHNNWAWETICARIESAPEGSFLKDAPGSGWTSLRDCLGHICFGYDNWMSVIRGGEFTGTNLKDLNTLTEVTAHRTRLVAGMHAFIEQHSDDELAEIREFIVRGEPARYSSGQLLAHALLHERGHHGDVSTLFYQLSIPIPPMDFRWHLPPQ